MSNRPLLLLPVPGIYSIRHRSGAEYVGSSKNVRTRAAGHRRVLESGKHLSTMLQNFWNTTDPSEWTYLILEHCPVEKLLDREQYWIDHSEYLLNHCLSVARVGRVLSDEARRSISEKAKARMADPAVRKELSERAKRTHAAGNLGVNSWTKGPDRDTPAVHAARAKRAEQLSDWSKKNNTSEVMRERSYMRKNIKKKPSPEPEATESPTK